MNTCPPCNGDCNQGRDCPAEDHSELMMAWLLPFAMVVIAVVTIAACRYFGWLM